MFNRKHNRIKKLEVDLLIAQADVVRARDARKFADARLKTAGAQLARLERVLASLLQEHGSVFISDSWRKPVGADRWARASSAVVIEGDHQHVGGRQVPGLTARLEVAE